MNVATVDCLLHIDSQILEFSRHNEVIWGGCGLSRSGSTRRAWGELLVMRLNGFCYPKEYMMVMILLCQHAVIIIVLDAEMQFSPFPSGNVSFAVLYCAV